MFAAMIYTDRFLLKIAVIGSINIHIFLRISIYQREPGTLHLDHQPVAFLKGMRHIGNRKLHCLHLAGSKRLGYFKAFAEAAAHDLGMDKHLVTAHRVGGWVVMATYR